MKYVAVYRPNHNPDYPVGILGAFDSKEDAAIFINELRLDSDQTDAVEVVEVEGDIKQALKVIRQTDADDDGLHC